MKFPFDATGTIGGLACERSLNLILAERNDPRLIKKITKLLQAARLRIKQLSNVTDSPTRAYFRDLLRRDLHQTVETITGVKVRGVPVVDPVASHTMCCLHAYFARAKL